MSVVVSASSITLSVGCPTSGGDATAIRGVAIDSTLSSPSDGDILVYRDAGSDWVAESKPAGGSNPTVGDLDDTTITSVGDDDILAYDSGTGDWINQTAAEAGVAAASHTHDDRYYTESEVDAISTTDRARANHTGTQTLSTISDAGAVAGLAAIQDGHIDSEAATDGHVLTADGVGGAAWEAPSGGSVAINDVTDITISAPADNEILAYNGIDTWINQTAAEAGLATASHNHSGTYEPVDATIIRQADVDDTPVNGATTVPVSSNWAYDLNASLAAVATSGSAADLSTGTLPDARIQASGVTQHQASLSITESQISDLDHDALKIRGVGVDSTVATPSDGDILVYRDAGSDWILEAKPAGGSNPALDDVTDVTLTSVGDDDILAYDSGTGDWINQTAAEAGLATASHNHSGTYQPLDADLTAIAAISGTGVLIERTASDTWGAVTVTTAGKALIDDADASAQRTTLGLGAVSTKGVTGADASAVTGTAGTSGDLAAWNADGDLVDGPTPPSGAIVGTTDTQTLTNKTITLSGQLSCADNVIERPYLKDYAEVTSAKGNISTTATLDLTAGNVFTATVTGAVTLTFSNPPASDDAGSFTLIMTNGGSATVTWPASVDWPGGTAPTLTSSGVDVLSFWTVDGGTTWYGVANLGFS